MLHETEVVGYIHHLQDGWFSWSLWSARGHVERWTDSETFLSMSAATDAAQRYANEGGLCIREQFHHTSQPLTI